MDGYSSFQDLADQRIDRLLTALTGRKVAPRPDATLLNGPSMAGESGQSVGGRRPVEGCELNPG